MPQETLQACPRPEHPRPDFMRDTFLNLNGQWSFAFDDTNRGLDEQWYDPSHPLDGKIIVPFCYQSKASGIGLANEAHPIMWYRRSFHIPSEMRGRRILLRFGAVDYACSVYINHQLVGHHEGGYSPFALEITQALKDGANDLCVRVQDEADCTQPRGKQYWNTGLSGCWYTPVSGIWQTVYLEAVDGSYLQYIHITPDIDHHRAEIQTLLVEEPREAYQIRVDISFDGKPYRTITVSASERSATIPVDMAASDAVDACALWWPDSPELYDVEVTILEGGRITDKVKTYFGMRKIESRNGTVYLNNRLLYQRLVLDQGYWPDTLLTPPSDEAIKADLQATLDFGYNGARKHQKMEDPRYYYWADRMGLLIWGEVPSAYALTDETMRRVSNTLLDFIERDFNHPSIIAWVPLNESWGAREIAFNRREQNYARMLYFAAKALDGTRLCSSNDGWEQVETDICALHDYTADEQELSNHFASREQVEQQGCMARACYASGAAYTGKEALMITEYGGIAFVPDETQRSAYGGQAWGYHGKVKSEQEFLDRFSNTMSAILNIEYCSGYCYTQLTDVMQEINGLMTYDRQPKIDKARFAALNRDPVGKQARGRKNPHLT